MPNPCPRCGSAAPMCIDTLDLAAAPELAPLLASGAAVLRLTCPDCALRAHAVVACEHPGSRPDLLAVVYDKPAAAGTAGFVLEGLAPRWLDLLIATFRRAPAGRAGGAA